MEGGLEVEGIRLQVWLARWPGITPTEKNSDWEEGLYQYFDPRCSKIFAILQLDFLVGICLVSCCPQAVAAHPGHLPAPLLRARREDRGDRRGHQPGLQVPTRTNPPWSDFKFILSSLVRF